MAHKYIIYFLLFIGNNLYAQTDSSENIYSIIQNAETNIICNNPNNATCSEKRIITILSEKGRSEANFACYCDKYNSLQSFHAPTANVIKKPAKVASQRYATDSFAGSSYQPTISTLSTPTTTLSNNTTQAAEAESDFSIRSIEEARKAIIWSEILRRKY